MATRYDEFMKTQPYLPYNMGGRLSEAMIAKAKEELGETEEVKAKTILELRQLVQAEAGLVCPTDDAYLLQYLRARKFDVKRAFTLLKNYYRIKRSYPSMYDSLDEESLKRAFAEKVGYVLPYRDEEGCAVALLKMGKWDVDVVNAPDAIITLTSVAMMVAQEPANQICGVRLLVDVRGTTLKQIRSLIPTYVILLARAFTFRLHGDNQKHLHKSIPKAILPAEDFGGDNTNDVGQWFKVEVEKYFELCHQLTSYGYRQ